MYFPFYLLLAKIFCKEANNIWGRHLPSIRHHHFFFVLALDLGSFGTWSNISWKDNWFHFMSVLSCRDLFAQHVHYHPMPCKRLARRVQHAVFWTMLQCVSAFKCCVARVFVDHGSSQQCCNFFEHLYGCVLHVFEGRHSELLNAVESSLTKLPFRRNLNTLQ